MANVDDEISFSSSAFDVVGSWLLCGKAASSKGHADEENMGAVVQPCAPLSLYRPSSKSASLTGSATATTKVLTEEEKNMKKKLLRKSGTYRHQQEEEKETVDVAAMDKEEEALLRAKHGEKTEANETIIQPTTKVKDSETTKAVVAPASSAVSLKKRKISAQEELLEKLREEAARKKAKNLKTKQRLQRKKEEARKLQTAA